MSEKESYNQGLSDFSECMKEVNLTAHFMEYIEKKIDLETFMILASNEIEERLRVI